MKLQAALTALTLTCLAAPADAGTVLRTRYPALSPDGATLAFSYQGDLWSVASSGGRAVRITAHPARDVQPVFSPDGKSLVFASNRFGNHDLYFMPAGGGTPRRLTWNSMDEFPTGFTPDGKWVLYYGSAWGTMDLYKVRTTGGEPIRLSWDRYEREYNGSVSPDGKSIVYNHNGHPQLWRRRGYEGSASAEIFIAPFATPLGPPRRITSNPGYDLQPVFSRDGTRIYYASDRKGQVNLWSVDLNGGSPQQLTQHTTDGVRLPSYAPQGEKIAYELDSRIYVLDLKSGQTGPVNIEVAADDRKNLVVEKTLTTGATQYAVSPDGKKIALIVRGDLFVTPATGGTARRLVGRPSRESNVSWMPDSRTLLFTTDQKGQKDIHRIELTGADERPVAATDQDESHPLASPDGKLVAYLIGDSALGVSPAAGGPASVTVRGNFYEATRVDQPRFDWSPDSKWLAYVSTDAKMDDAIHVASVADGQSRRISRNFKVIDTRPRWSPSGSTLFFSGAPFIVDESMYGFSPSANVYAISVDGDPRPHFEEDHLDRLDEPADAGRTPAIEVAFEGIENRIRRVTACGFVGPVVVSPSGKTLYVQRSEGISAVSTEATDARPGYLVERARGAQLPRDGSRLYFMAENELQSMGIQQRDRSSIAYSATVRIDQEAEQRQVFNETWWLMDRYFYAKNLNGVDWKAVRARYEAMLPFVSHKDDFYDMLEEMVQELKGSHLGLMGPGDYSAENAAAAAYVGIEPDWAALESQGVYRVARVVAGSPAASRWSRINVGEYLLAVDGQELGNDVSLEQLLDRKVGKKVVLTVNTQPSSAGAREVTLKPIGLSQFADLEYEAWVERCRARVSQLSGGKIGYLHVRQMTEVGELRFREDLMNHGAGKDALLVDVRYNPGGYVAHKLLDVLRKKPYIVFRPRTVDGKVTADWFTDVAWGKPAALLVNQDSASNAEMMAEGFRALGLGPVIGTPTRGAVIATGGWELLDGGRIRIPSSGVYTASGEDLDAKGRTPDVAAPYDAAAAREGKDPQLDRAVQVLQERLRAATARPAVSPAGKAPAGKKN